MNAIRQDFPIFSNRFDREKIIYADNASTTLKPQTVIDKVVSYYDSATTNVMRGNSSLSEEISIEYTKVRETVARFINCASDEIIFTHGATDSINLLCDGLNFDSDDEIIVSVLEHHSNFLPWMKKGKIKIVPVGQDGIIDLELLEKNITSNTKVISVTYVSNVTGVIQPIQDIVKIARKYNICTCIDASQAVSHFRVDVRELDCDFMCFSGHKLFGPSGVGILYAKRSAQSHIQKSRFGGGMVDFIDQDNGSINFKSAPYMYEAGTPNIEGVLGLGKAIEYIQSVGMDAITQRNEHIKNMLLNRMESISNIKMLFPYNQNKIPLATFQINHADIDQAFFGRILGDSHGIILSSGNQCATPLYNHFKSSPGIRVSFHAYNNDDEVDHFIQSLETITKLWS